MEVDELKDKGNQALESKEYDSAIELYSQAIALAPTNHILYSNRSAAQYKKENWKESLLDALKSVEILDTWGKGYYRAAEAYVALNRMKEACLMFDKVIALNPPTKALTAAHHKCYSTYVQNYFKPLIGNKDITISYINQLRGRGVFAKRDYMKSEMVYFESPLMSHRNVSEDKVLDVTFKDACSYTMKSILDIDGLKRPFDYELKAYFQKNNIGNPVFVPCPHCKDDELCAERYVSENIQKKAWNEYHQILCVGVNGSTHPYKELFEKAKAMKRTNPLFIIRMMAHMVQRAKNIAKDDTLKIKPKSQITIEAMEPYSMFITNQEVGPLDEETVEVLRKILGTDEYNDIVSLETYRSLNGAILRNAQALNPVSDVHMMINATPRSKLETVLFSYNANFKSTDQFLADHYGQSLCISGTGLFLIANSTNHSCDPNLVATSATNNYMVTMIALKDIKAGEELTISYIDKDMDYRDRQAKLKEMYLFDCACDRCKYRW
jgi:tetratricopeptide (TPR) repeat protein